MGDQGSSRPGAVRSAGTKKRAAIAVFVAATFSLMALLSVPSRFLPPALHIPAPIKQALNPLAPFIPPGSGGGGREPGGTAGQGLLGAGVRASLLAAPLRSVPIPPPPAPGTKGPVLPQPVSSIDLRRAGSQNEFLPEVSKGNTSKRAIHRHRRHHRHHRRHHHRCSYQRRQRQGVRQLPDVKTAAKPGHPQWRGEPGRRGGPVR